MVGLNSTICFVGLGVALWLGVYLVTRSRQRLAWLGAGTLWALVGYFLNRLVNLNFTHYAGVAFLGGWTAILAAPLWYHLSTEVRPDAPAARPLRVVGYAAAALFYVLMTTTELVFQWRGTVPAVVGADTYPGPLYGLLGLFLLAYGGLGGWNLRTAARQSRPALRPQVQAMLRATLVAVLGAAYLVVIDLLRLPWLSLVGDALLVVAVALMGYAMARYNALLEGRAAGKDMPYAAAAISLVALAYLLGVWVYYRAYGIELSAFVPVLILVILSHTLYDGFRNRLDRVFYRRSAAQLRESLRGLAREAGTVDVLDPALRDTLSAACTALGTDRGLIALRRAGALTVAASLRAGAPGHPLADIPLPEDAAPVTTPLPGLTDMAAVAPLVWAGEGLGFVAVGPRPGGYSGDELAVLADVADRIAGVVYASRTAETATAELSAQVEAFRARERDLQRQVQALTTPPAAETPDEREMTRLVEDGLRRLHDFAYLGEHRLAALRAVEARLSDHDGRAVTLLERGQALREVLVRGVERLRPAGAEPVGDSAAGRREWYAYIILRDSYIEDVPNRDTMNRLYLSEGTYNRSRRQALRGVARALAEEEAQAIDD